MSLGQTRISPTLLGAAADGDEFALKYVFKKISIEGIKPEVLNAQDSSGRTAFSHMCSNGSLINFVDMTLQLFGIDVNKADNEGNTPLHFAAQSGQSDIINMLITRSRSLKVDLQNSWGMTPLMKASVQGRVKCAKLLLFAGASTIQTDYGRKLNAIEWANLTGRESCAQMLESVSKARQQELPAATSAQPKNRNKNKVHRSQTNPNIKHSDSFFAKLNRLMPFKSSKKEKTNSKVDYDKSSKSSVSKNSSLSRTVSVPERSRLNDFLTPIAVPKYVSFLFA